VQRTAALAFAVLALAGCATAPPAVAPVRPEGDAPFAIEGRLSARHGNDALAANFQWTHAPPIDALVLTTPTGQGIAEIRGDASVRRVEVRGANGLSDTAPDWSTLTERALGAPVPVEGLAAWMQGLALPATQHTLQRDAAGRVALLQQDGWQVVFDYAGGAATRPARVRLTRDDIDLRIAVERWD
jgi:outer membrane lipoprotein LolB